MAVEVQPKWAKLFVDGQLQSADFPFAVEPTPGLTFHTVGSDVHRVESVRPDPDFPGRFIVLAERIG